MSLSGPSLRRSPNGRTGARSSLENRAPFPSAWPATLGSRMCCDGSDSLAPVRVFSGVLARVNHSTLESPLLSLTVPSRKFAFAGILHGPGRSRTYDLGGLKVRLDELRRVADDGMKLQPRRPLRCNELQRTAACRDERLRAFVRALVAYEGNTCAGEPDGSSASRPGVSTPPTDIRSFEQSDSESSRIPLDDAGETLPLMGL